MAGPLLEFETEMFLSLLGSDGLVVAAEGMGIDRVLLQFMRVYSEPGSLVLLLNTTTPEQVKYTRTFTHRSRLLKKRHSIVLLVYNFRRRQLSTTES